MTRYLFALIFILSFLTGCNNAPPASTAGARFRPIYETTVTLPTAAPPTEIPPTNTLVMAHPWTPTPVPSATPFPREALGLITGVLSPETVVIVLQGDRIQQTYVVRLLGVDAPPNTPAEPWGTVAFDTLDKWLTGKIVRIEQDTTIANDADELPRYLYLEESLINLKLIELGLARPHFEAPDTSLKAEFEAAAQKARAAKIGLWGPDPTPTPLPSPTPTLTATMIITVTQTPTVTATVPLTVTPTVTAASVLTTP